MVVQVNLKLIYSSSSCTYWTNAERVKHEESKDERQALNATLRHDALSSQNTRNGDVLRPAIGDEKLFPKRRHFPDRANDVEVQNHARQKVGASRFHIELTTAESEQRKRQIENRLQAQKQSTSVIGYGRSDLPTFGVADVFNSNYGYNGSDLISKPKLKPPPSDSQAAKWSVGQIKLEDGSGFGFQPKQVISETRAAGRASGSNSNSSRLNTGDVRPTAATATADATAAAPSAGRRVNRSNATSAQLQEVFSYAGIADRWQNGNAIRSPVRPAPIPNNNNTQTPAPASTTAAAAPPPTASAAPAAAPAPAPAPHYSPSYAHSPPLSILVQLYFFFSFFFFFPLLLSLSPSFPKR